MASSYSAEAAASFTDAQSVDIGAADPGLAQLRARVDEFQREITTMSRAIAADGSDMSSLSDSSDEDATATATATAAAPGVKDADSKPSAAAPWRTAAKPPPPPTPPSLPATPSASSDAASQLAESPGMPEFRDLVTTAQFRWLSITDAASFLWGGAERAIKVIYEVLGPVSPPVRPSSGTVFTVDERRLPTWRQDGYTYHGPSQQLYKRVAMPLPSSFAASLGIDRRWRQQLSVIIEWGNVKDSSSVLQRRGAGFAPGFSHLRGMAHCCCNDSLTHPMLPLRVSQHTSLPTQAPMHRPVWSSCGWCSTLPTLRHPLLLISPQVCGGGDAHTHNHTHSNQHSSVRLCVLCMLLFSRRCLHVPGTPTGSELGLQGRPRSAHAATPPPVAQKHLLALLL